MGSSSAGAPEAPNPIKAENFMFVPKPIPEDAALGPSFLSELRDPSPRRGALSDSSSGTSRESGDGVMGEDVFDLAASFSLK